MVKSIKKGEFIMEGQEWRGVSDSAKELISGLGSQCHTRLILYHNTLELQPHSAPTTELPLTGHCEEPLQSELLTTLMKAFHVATQNGFVLRDSTNAPLARKRKKKHTSPLPLQETYRLDDVILL